ncbi:MAG: M28 family peptidase [Balneolaceae bacterium]
MVSRHPYPVQRRIVHFGFGVLLLLASGCLLESGDSDRYGFQDRGHEVPGFSGENAREFVEAQLQWGPRVPGSDAHQQTLEWLEETLSSYAGPASVYRQHFEVTGYEGDSLELSNLLASFSPEKTDRILLAAHWDSRPRAEEDPDRPDDPILGADDGGSGVAVLLELARHFSEYPPPIGVDLLLFDGEDYGHPGDLDFYFLGSRYWSQNPPVPGYRPRFGILLDMVGGEEAVFPKERYSLQYAPALTDAVWDLADELGYGESFPDRPGAYVSDDHLMVNRYTEIPMINIIHHRATDQGSAIFPPWWHSHEDTLDIIDPATLEMTGQLLLELIYNRLGT